MTGLMDLYPGRPGEPVGLPEETLTHSHPVLVAIVQHI